MVSAYAVLSLLGYLGRRVFDPEKYLIIRQLLMIQVEPLVSLCSQQAGSFKPLLGFHSQHPIPVMDAKIYG